MTVSRLTPTWTGSALNIATATATGTYYLGIGSSTTSAPSSWTKNAALTATNVGTYYVWAKCDASTNYNAVSQYYVGTATINKATGYLTATAPSSALTYNGSAQTIGTISTNSGTYYFGLGTSTTGAPSSWGAANTKLTATNAGTYYVWAKCDASTNYNAVAAKYIATVTINKKSTTVTYNPSNLTVQALNSATYLNELTRVEFTKPTAGSGSAGCTIASIKNSSGQNATTISLQYPYLRLDASTPVGTYTVTMNASCDGNHTADIVTKSYTVTVVADTASAWKGTLSLNNTSTLSAGADERTITWGNIYKTWTYGGGEHSRATTAYLSISCNNSTYGGYVTLESGKTSYANSTSTMTTKLTKTTCGSTTFSSDVTFTIYLRADSSQTLVTSTTIKGSKNVSTITPLSVMYYGAPTLTFVSGTLTPGNSSVQVSCTANNLMAVRLDYTSGYYTNTSATVAASTSWALTGQSCVGNATRFSVSGNTLTHTTMGKTLGTDVAILQVKNLTNNSTTAVSKVVTNSMAHTLTSMSMTYTVASYSSGSKNTPTVRYNTTYRYTSGAAGGSTTGNTGSITGATFTKTFKKNSGSTDGSLNTSTGVVTWNYANTTNMSKVMNITCTGQLVSQGTTTSGTAMANAYQAVSNLLIVTFVNKGQCPSTAQLQVNSTAGSVGTINSSTAIGGSFYITSSSTSIVFTLVLSGVSSSTRAVIHYQNATGTSSNISSTTMYASSYSGGSTYPYTGTKTFTVQRPNTSNAGMCNINVTIYN